MAKRKLKAAEPATLRKRIARTRATETAAASFVGAMWASGREGAPWHGFSP